MSGLASTASRTGKPVLFAVFHQHWDVNQVLLNLLLNAADACPEKGKIVMTADKKAVPLEVNNEKTLSDFLVISVQDNGSGIEPDAFVLTGVNIPYCVGETAVDLADEYPDSLVRIDVEASDDYSEPRSKEESVEVFWEEYDNSDLVTVG